MALTAPRVPLGEDAKVQEEGSSNGYDARHDGGKQVAFHVSLHIGGDIEYLHELILA